MTTRFQTIIIHVLGCILFLSIPVVFSPDFRETSSLYQIRPFQREFLSSILLIVFFYMNYYVFIPKFYVTKKFVVFTALILLSFMVVSFLPQIILVDYRPPREMLDMRPPGPPREQFPLLFLKRHVPEFLVIFVFSLLLNIRERLKQTETEKANAELQYLKAQINPHFLFNTLNSIYSLAISKSDKTANAIIKLSDMMRYVLNDSHHNFVLLEKELKYISSYIELQRMRLTANTNLNYVLEGKIEEQKIAPLVLIPFIENAFKHGANSEENSTIEVKISVTDTRVDLFVKNDCVSSNNNTLNKSGFGIKNTKNRLKFLYPQQHRLEIKEENKTFSIHLILNIHD